MEIIKDFLSHTVSVDIHQVISFFVGELLEPFILILLGGIFVLAEISLAFTKGEFSENAALRRPQPALRLIATFCFVMAVVVATKNLDDDLLLHPSILAHWLLLTGLTSALTVAILFFGILLPRAIGETEVSSWLTKYLSHMAQVILRLIDPFARVVEFAVLRFLKFFGLHLYENAPASDEEVIHMMDEGLNTGVFKVSEKEMVQAVLDLDQHITASLMTPRSSFVWLNLDDEDEINWRHVAQSGHSEFPVFKGTHDHIKGVVCVKALWANLSLTGSVKLADVTSVPLYVSSTMTTGKLIEEFRLKKTHTALVIDEFGAVEGIVTLKDVMESIIGMLPKRGVQQYYPKVIEQPDGGWLSDALLDVDKAISLLGLPIKEKEQEENRYQTLGGFFLAHLGHIPHCGEFLVWENFRFEVISMKHHRIEKLLVTKVDSSQIDSEK